jgi:membrane protein YdbS with pleckstrin-like domain
MRTTSPIDLAANSFARFDDAQAMCELLYRETGSAYTVMSDNHLGFTTRRSRTQAAQPQPALADRQRPEVTEYRQAFRGFVPHYLEIAAGALLMAYPFKVTGWLFDLLNIQNIPDWMDLKDLGTIYVFAGLALTLYGLRFIYSYFAVKMVFDHDGVMLKKGIIAQSHVQIRFNDIKTVGVEQSVLDRLLGIGTVHLDSAGTNGTVDIELRNMYNPAHMRRRIQQLIDQYTKQRG